MKIINSLNTHKHGFSLIELLVVLVIVGVLAAVSTMYLTPKSPKATRAALLDLRNDIQSARQAAISGGKIVRIKLEWIISAGEIKFSAIDASMAEVNQASLIFSGTLSKNIMSYCGLMSKFDDLPTTSTTVNDLNSLTSTDFKSSGSGWVNCLKLGTITYGFNSNGVPVLLQGTSPNITVSPLIGGFWVGIAGKTSNNKGLPYGVILVTEQGRIITYYKGDSLLDDSVENKWKRLE